MKTECAKISFAALLVTVAFTIISAATREPEITPAGNVIICDWNKKGWSVRGKKTSNPKGIVDTKTPSGAPALTFKTTGKGKSILCGGILSPNGKWCDKKYNSISFWIKNNGEAKLLIFRFWLQNGKSAQLLLRLPSQKGWIKKELPLNDVSSMVGKLKFLMIRTFEVVDFSIGPIILNQGSTSLQLEEYNQASAVFTPQPPVIDGIINEPLWSKAKFNSLKYRMRSDKAPKEKTNFKLLYDKENIYIAAKLMCKDFSKLKAVHKDNSLSMFSDDCFEFFIDSRNDLNTMSQFVINSKGAKTAIRRVYHKVKDQFVWDKKWRPQWRGACKLQGNEWTLELAIPLKEIGIPPTLKDRNVFIQAGRENHILREFSTFSPTSKFPVIKNFGYLVFAAPGTENGLEITDVKLSKTDKGKFIFNAELKGIAKEQKFTTDLTLVNETGYQLTKKLIPSVTVL